jgi:ParB/RepB/Spo0J family partition protein
MARAAAAVTGPPHRRTDPASIEDLAVGLIVQRKNVRVADQKELGELTESIIAQGVLEPLLVTRGTAGTYNLVAGYRRLAAAKAAKLKTVPVRVLQLTDAEVAEVQLAENLQREGLTELEEARAFKAYVDAGHTQGDLGKRIGKSQPYVSNRMRLMGLPSQVQDLLSAGKLSASHAEVLLKVPKEAEPIMVQAAKDAARNGTSVESLDRDLSWKSRQHLEAVAFKTTVDGSKFPKCPTCGERASESPAGYGPRADMVGHGMWQNEHHWRLTDGKTVKELRTEEQAKHRKAAAAARGPPAPKRDLSQGAVTHASPHPAAIARKLLEQLGDDGVADVWIGGGIRCEGTLGPCIHIHATDLAKLPTTVKSTIRVRPRDYTTGEKAQITVVEWDGFNAKDRKGGIAAFQHWARKSLPAAKGPAKGALAADPELLKGNVTEVLSRLLAGKQGKRPCDSDELIEQLRELEARGQNRPTVLERFDEWLDVAPE